jgi:hypothetical protein
MSKATNNWAHTHRNNQAIRVAITLIVLLFFALILGDNSGSYLRTEREGYSRFSGQTKNITYVVSLILADDTQFKFMLQQSPPKVGTKVPVLVDIYDDGKNYYRYSLMDWQLLK